MTVLTALLMVFMSLMLVSGTVGVLVAWVLAILSFANRYRRCKTCIDNGQGRAGLEWNYFRAVCRHCRFQRRMRT